MKKIFTLIFIAFVFNTIQSQTYHPLVKNFAEWKEVDIHCYSKWSPCIYVNDLCLINDTGEYIFNNHKYRSLNIFSSSSFIFIREDSVKKVYLYFPFGNNFISADTNEFVIYNFSLNIGDTLIAKRANMTLYNIITNIDSVHINGEYRKRFHISRYGSGSQFYWIEGIGSTYGILGNYYYPFEGAHELICFTDSVINYMSPQFANCNGYQSVDEIMLNSVNIYPNPASDFLQIENIDGKITADIYSMDGKLQKTIVLADNNLIKINDLTMGVYILKIRNDKDISYHKFIKQ